MKIEIEEYNILKNVINIDLFNDVVFLIMETTQIDYRPIWYQLSQNNMLFKKTNNNTIQNEYKINYLGELLERYSQRIGTDIKDVRAISLALSYSKELITDNMIIGTQLVDFINNIKNLSKDDIYLKGSLYLYDKVKYASLLDEISTQNFSNIEEVIFALSLFDNISVGFDKLNSQLTYLLGNGRTMSIMENVGIYNWLIKILHPIVKNKRKKEFELFKALVSIPTGLIKEDSKTYQILVKYNYTKEDIAFLNYILLFYRSVPNTVKTRYSIVEEKIAINFCANILNSKNTYNDDIYNLIQTMLDYYNRFKIKCYGFSGLREALVDAINIQNPNVFIKFYNIFYKTYSFDILDEKWDIVYKTFKADAYRVMFDNYLLFNDYDTEQIKQRITKYEKLTNSSYLNTFFTFNWNRDNIYTKLVEKDIIDLKWFFEEYMKNENDTTIDISLKHLEHYVEGIHYKKAFLFLKYFLSLEKYNIKDTTQFGFDLRSLFNINHSWYAPSSSCKILDIERKFLSSDEQKQLLMWLEEFIFYTFPNRYMEFIKCMLDDKLVSTLFSQEDLKKLYLYCVKIDESLSSNKILRQKYLSKEELELLEKEEKEAEECQKLLKKKEMQNEIIREFNSIEQKTLENIYNFCSDYKWYSEKREFAYNVAKQYLFKGLSKYSVTCEDIIYFNQICNLFIENNFMNIYELKTLIMNYIGKGGFYYAKNTRTYKAS